MTDVKRAYDASRRRAAAEETRRRLADTARRLFSARGYAATTVEAIAAAAGTSPQTFYNAFRTKSGVLLALLDDMARRADPAALGAALGDAPGPAEQLALLVDYRLRIYTGAYDVLELVRSTAPLEPDVAAVWDEGERRRRRNQAALLRAWRSAGALRADVPPARADDVLWALTGPDVYRLLVVECGWSTRRLREWLTTTLQAQLLAH